MTVIVTNHLDVTTNANQVGTFEAYWTSNGTQIAQIAASAVDADGLIDSTDGLKWNIPVELAPGEYDVTVAYNRSANFSRIEATSTVVVRGQATVEFDIGGPDIWVNEGDV